MPINLPPNKIERELKDLDLGESAYTTPWAMTVFEDGRAFLNCNYPACKRPGGTVSMKVTRLTERNFEVNIREVFDNYKWSLHSGTADRSSSWYTFVVTDLIS